MRQKPKRRFYSKQPLSKEGTTRVTPTVTTAPRPSGSEDARTVKKVKKTGVGKGVDVSVLPAGWENTKQIVKACVMHAYSGNVRSYVCAKVDTPQARTSPIITNSNG